MAKSKYPKLEARGLPTKFPMQEDNERLAKRISANKKPSPGMGTRMGKMPGASADEQEFKRRMDARSDRLADPGAASRDVRVEQEIKGAYKRERDAGVSDAEIKRRQDSYKKKTEVRKQMGGFSDKQNEKFKKASAQKHRADVSRIPKP